MHASNKLPVYPDLAGKAAVVTGGSGGIGAATGRLLAQPVRLRQLRHVFQSVAYCGRPAGR